MNSIYSTAETFQKILNSAPILLMSFRAIRDDVSTEIIDFEWVTANKMAVETVGHPLEQLIGKRLLVINPYNKPLGLFDLYVQVVETGETRQTEIAYDADGVNGWYDITATKLDDGFILAATDITTRKQAERQLAQRTEQLQTTLDASLNSIMSMTAIRDGQPTAQFPKGKIVDFWMTTANQAVIQSLGHSPDEMVGVRLLDMFPGNVESGLFEVYARVTDSGHSERTLQYYTDDKGLDGWFEVQVVKQGDNGVVLTFMNVTEAKRHEKQLQRSNESLQEFAYVASHDLQEPLRKVQAFSNILAAQYGSQLEKTGLDLLGRMQSATHRMQVLIRDLLTYSRLSTEVPALKSLNLNDVLAGVLSDLETTITAKKAVLDIAPLPTVQGDALQFRQLFQNLLSNALKFVEPGVTPHIQITHTVVEGRKIAAGLTGNYQAIRLADNGIGFDKSHRDRIFEAFQRLQGRSQYEGTGIGLAIVKRVVELHKGHIIAESEPGKGSVFTVHLPV